MTVAAQTVHASRARRPHCSQNTKTGNYLLSRGQAFAGINGVSSFSFRPNVNVAGETCWIRLAQISVDWLLGGWGRNFIADVWWTLTDSCSSVARFKQCTVMACITILLHSPYWSHISTVDALDIVRRSSQKNIHPRLLFAKHRLRTKRRL